MVKKTNFSQWKLMKMELPNYQLCPACLRYPILKLISCNRHPILKLISWSFVTNLVADGSACETLHTRESSTTAEHEINRCSINDSFIDNRRLGCWLFLWKPSSSQSDVWAIEKLLVNNTQMKLVEDYKIQICIVYISDFLHVNWQCFRRVGIRDKL